MQYKYCSCYYMKTSPPKCLIIRISCTKTKQIFFFFMRLLGQWDFKGFWPLFLWDFKGFQPCFCGFGNDSSTCSFGNSKDSRPSFCGFGNDSKPCSDSKPCLYGFSKDSRPCSEQDILPQYWFTRKFAVWCAVNRINSRLIL